MKVFKIILILVLLFSVGFGLGRLDVFGDSDNATSTSFPYYVDGPDVDSTLLEWFMYLDLDEKVEIYDWWKEKYLPENCDWTFIWNSDWETRMFDDEAGIFYIETPKGEWFIEMEKMVDWKENAIKIYEGKPEKYIVSYYESLEDMDYGTLDIRILNLKLEETEVEKNKIVELIGDENIDSLYWSQYCITGVGKINIGMIFMGENAVEKLRAIRDKLLENGFKYGKGF